MKSLKTLALIAGIAIASLTTGCASITGGTSQTVSLQTKQDATEVAGADCELKNEKGTYHVTTPGKVTVHRAYGDLQVTCSKAGQPDAVATVQSSTKGATYGNIILGGGIGAGVDMATGAAYAYPDLITMLFGKDLTMKGSTVTDTVKKPVDGKANVASNQTAVK
jgi:hypothetical protein